METDQNQVIKKPVLTEDLGKIFEMAICILFCIPYVGNYKYSVAEATSLSLRVEKLKQVFPYNLQHTAKNGSPFDFTCVDDSSIKLSAKTSKKDGKVCPQIIGQPSRKKFCEYFALTADYDVEKIKDYILNNVTSMLCVYLSNTFDCPIIYYNKNRDLVQFIKMKQPIDWSLYKIEFSHINKMKKWNESTTISINNICIGEFQVHNHRDCIKFRWAFEKLLALFGEHFEIIIL